MSQDVILDRYGRLYHLPYELSLLGHDVYGNCLSYQKTSPYHESPKQTTSNTNRLTWTSEYAGILGYKIPYYVQRLLKAIKRVQPDVILGSSDVLHAIITHIVGVKTNIPYFLDLYDNYESFGMCKIPGMRYAYRKALRNAESIFTVSNTLREHIQSILPSASVITIESTISEGSFGPYDKTGARKILKLPQNKILVGTAGSLSINRGTEHLYKAFFKVKEIFPTTCLVLAGPVGDNPPPDNPDILYLGQLPHPSIPLLFNALDVAVICMKDNNFGRYAFPQKAFEILACKVPVVCSAVGALKNLLADYQDCLYIPDDTLDLAYKIRKQINTRIIPDIYIPTWKDQAQKLQENLLIKTNREAKHNE